MTDPIADMLTRIRNAVAVKKLYVALPFSKVKLSIAKLLEAEKYVSKVEEIELHGFKQIKISLKYDGDRPAIAHLKRISKPGQKIYIGSQEVPKILNGYGIAIVSTSKGVMTGLQARKDNIGGELMCEIW
ncbi:30S ribosomal protein S8 [bacterium]|jgi:small subunit ribosomal protein S8|nr:30S ribosomal protein S8 [bacterium]MBT4649516.1 30S ribosomal protein S8 [bacterium]